MTWITLLLTVFGAGATGAVITTFGGQSRDRREARARVRTTLATAERLCQTLDTSPDAARQAIFDVENAAFMAAVPSRVIAIYRDARLADYLALKSRKESRFVRPSEDVTSIAAMGAAALLVRV